MTNDPREDFDSSVEGAEREALLSLARQLHEERPLPSAGFRSAVRTGLLRDPARRAPSHFRAMVMGYAGSGALLLAIAAIGLAGVGPFGAG